MNRCPFPNCTLEMQHDGDHDLARPTRPRGPLRLAQTFNGAMCNSPRCDLEPYPGNHDRAFGLYVDQFAFGWILCQTCIVEVIPQGVPNAEAQGNKTASPPPAQRSQPEAPPAPKSRVTRHASVIDFAARERGIR